MQASVSTQITPTTNYLKKNSKIKSDIDYFLDKFKLVFFMFN